ncbi:general secretion pathway protein GspC [Marinobacter daepoensis]|uniref:General secretion pathway protein GspC n=1 Tax=Marinobacter daepoensis TaxID=262077 RepID=A0ABS3BBI8_9GAMM|nr:type II secretion system protein N [Marinobacter daepoensis]MBN7769127.1 general secretion pathway protein GspC [Marinobacter daepoensis]MBY6077817.1 general secretion pathway protein GspC [Marinobacter daepoensis]
MLAIDQRTPLFLAVVAAVAMLGFTGWQGYQFWQTESHRPLSQTPPSDTIMASQERPVPDVRLSDLEVFGAPGALEQAADTNTENLPETNLRLSLRGVLAADGDFPGSALIEDEKGKTEAFLVGNELPGNARLRTVFANRVIIERAGKLENLYFPETDDRSGVDFASNSEPSREPPATEPSRAQQSGSQTSAPPAEQQQRREEIRKRLEQLRQRLQNNS